MSTKLLRRVVFSFCGVVFLAIQGYSEEKNIENKSNSGVRQKVDGDPAWLRNKDDDLDALEDDLNVLNDEEFLKDESEDDLFKIDSTDKASSEKKYPIDVSPAVKLKTLVRFGVELYQNNRLRKSRTMFHRALALDKENKKAIAYLKLISERIYERANDLYKKGLTAIEKENYREALVTLQKGIEVDPSHSGIKDVLKNPLLQHEKKVWEEKKRKQHKKVLGLLAQAEQHVKKEEYYLAFKNLLICLKLEPQNEDVNRLYSECRRQLGEKHLKLAKSLMALGEKKEAFREVRQALVYIPDSSVGKWLLSELQDPTEDDGKKEIIFLIQRGLDAYHWGDHDQAIHYWKKVLEVDPQNQQVQEYLGMLDLDTPETNGSN